MLPTLALLLLANASPSSKSASVIPLTLDQRIASVLPTAEEDRWRSVGWRVNLMAARDEAQKALDGARGKIASDSAAARAKLEQESTALTRQIVKKILGREVA